MASLATSSKEIVETENYVQQIVTQSCTCAHSFEVVTYSCIKADIKVVAEKEGAFSRSTVWIVRITVNLNIP
jgi:hypothetical protein